MFSRRVYPLIVIVLFLTILDIAIVETWYRPLQDWTGIWKYHLVYWTLIIALPIAVAYKQKSYVPLLTYPLFLFGVEDTLFYLMQGTLPPVYYGVTFAGIFHEPSLQTGLTLNLAGITITALAYRLFVKQRRLFVECPTLQ